MKNYIFIIFLSIVFGFLNIPQQMQNELWFWGNYFTRQIPSNSDQQKKHQTTSKISYYENLDK